MLAKILSNVKSLIASRIIQTFFTTYALVVLIQLLLWNLELRSVVILIGQSGLIAMVLLPLFYNLTQLDPKQISWKMVKSAFLAIIPLAVVGAVLIPAQTTAARFYLANAIFVLAAFVALLGLIGLRFSAYVILVFEYALWIAFLGGIIGAGILLLDGSFARMYADDFIYTLERLNRGYWYGQLWFYTNWSGRLFSNILVLGLADWRWLPFTQIVGILATSILTFVIILKDTIVKKVVIAIFVTGWLLFTVVSIIPDFYKSLYWIVASAASVPYMYLIPLYILVIVISMTSTRKSMLVGLGILAGLLSLMIATTHEAGVVGWVAAQVAVLAVSRFKIRQIKRWQYLVCIGVAAGVLGFGLQLFSPGNLYRGDKQDYAQTVQILPLLKGTLTFYFQYLKSIPITGQMLLLSLIGVGALVPIKLPREWKWVISTLIATQFIAASCFTIGVYVFSGPIPLRTHLIPAVYLAYGFFAAGLFLPRPGSKQLAIAYTVIFLLISAYVSLPNLNRLAGTIQPFRQFAQDWDERDAVGRQNSAKMYLIHIPWEKYEAKFIFAQEYYSRIDAIPDDLE